MMIIFRTLIRYPCFIASDGQESGSCCGLGYPRILTAVSSLPSVIMKSRCEEASSRKLAIMVLQIIAVYSRLPPVSSSFGSGIYRSQGNMLPRVHNPITCFPRPGSESMTPALLLGRIEPWSRSMSISHPRPLLLHRPCPI